MKTRVNDNGKQMVKNESFEIGTAKANYIIKDILADFKKGIDFAVVFKGQKPTLLIGGADKLSWRFNLIAEFNKDLEIEKCFADVKNLVVMKCELIMRNTRKKVGEGRGSAILGEGGNCRTIHSTIKMAEIRAKRDAVLNVFPIRDRFTQDMETETFAESKVAVDGDGNISL